MTIIEGICIMLEQILTDKAFIVRNYIASTIALTKSMLLTNSYEAKLFNSYIENNYPKLFIDKSDKTTWRYYRHLVGEKHPIDSIITLLSVDNLDTIELTKTNLLTHKKTREELLKFGSYYQELIQQYPNHDIYIKAIITDVKYSLYEVVNLPDLTIVAYNASHIEENELDLVDRLQERLNNYKVTWSLAYYSKSDTLFLAAQYAILYNYIVTSIIALRLKNAKTVRAHSFHIKNYLASHHYLDTYYTYLNKTQRLFLYKNLLYIDNHVGNNEIFNLLIQKLFIDRNISISTYNYFMLNTLTEDRNADYRFRKHYFNSIDKDFYNYKLEDIKNKEYELHPGNSKHWDFNTKATEISSKNSLFNSLLTKDLETAVYDYTDNVKHKLLDTIFDYTAYFCKANKANFIIKLNNSTNTNTINIPIKDVFKLMIILLYRYNNEDISEFPTYRIKRVRKDILPSTDYLLKLNYKKYYYYKTEIDKIKFSFIPYPGSIASSYQLYEYVNKCYLLDIGLWFYTSNLSMMDNEGQFRMMINDLFKTEDYSFNDEAVSDFIHRVALDEINYYSKDQLIDFFMVILNTLYDNRYLEIFNLSFIQQAMIGVFKKFKSYTTQIISDYFIKDLCLTENRSARYGIATDIHSKVYYFDNYTLNVDTKLRTKYNRAFNFNTIYDVNYEYKGILDLSIPNLKIQSKILANNKLLIFLANTNVSTNQNAYVVQPSSQDTLRFLAFN